MGWIIDSLKIINSVAVIDEKTKRLIKEVDLLIRKVEKNDNRLAKIETFIDLAKESNKIKQLKEIIKND